MEDENEVLDWGNEDDEQLHSETHRKASFTQFGSQNVDDAEDAVSLGEDEEEQDYSAYRQQESNKDADTLLRESASKDDFYQQQSESSRELHRQSSSTSQNPSSAPGSPDRNQSSSDQPNSSPQRSHSFTTRLTHALPPKPVVANVPYLHPSHPSIVEATAMSTRRSESLKNKSNGTSTTTASTTGTKLNGADAPLPPDWEVRNPRGGGLKVYYYNNQTKQSTWDRPVSSSNASPSLGRSTRRRRERSQSAGGRPSSPFKSDQPTLQEHSRSSRVQPNVQGDSDITDPQQPLQHSGELSFEDRHYRPQEPDDNVVNADNRHGDRHEEPAFTPPASPRRSRSRAPGRDRERGRSLSPMRSEPPVPSRGRDSRSSRGSRGGRHSHAVTDADSSIQRDRDHSLAFASPRNAWDHTPSNMPVDLNSSNNHQGSRRQQRQQQPYNSNFDSSLKSLAFEDRQSLSRNGSTRGRNRGRESRATEGHEQQNRSQNLSTTSRTRSPPPHLHEREMGTLQQQSNQLLPKSTVSTSPAPEVMPAQSQRRRDRPSRFDRPATMVLPAGTANATAQIITPVEQTIVQPLEDDVYIPDDIIQASRERIRHIVRDELTPASQQIVHPGKANGASYHDKRSRPDERDWEQGPLSAEQGRTSPISEHPASRRKRVPLPPQDIRFHEAVIRPQQAPPDVDSVVPHQYYRPPPPHLSPSQPTMAPQGPRDHHQRSTGVNSSNLPSGPRYPPQLQPRGETDMQRMMPPSSGIDSGRRGDRRLSGTPYAQSLPHSEVVIDVDVNDHPSTSSRIPPSPSRNSEAQLGLRVGAGMYADRESGISDVLPRGPRAMASKQPLYTPDGSFPSQPSASLSPTAPYAHGPIMGGRGRDRSPLQQLGYVNDRVPGHDHSRHESASGWREEGHNQGYPALERGHGHGRRDPKGRPNEFSRPTLPKLSGTNSVPIGNRKGGVHGGTPPGVMNRFASNLNPPPGISNANMEPLRNPRVRGPPPPEKESYERPTFHAKGQMDTYIPGRSESIGPLQRRRDGSPVASERRQHQRQVSPVDSPPTTRARQELQYNANERLNRFDHAVPQDPAAAPRIWTPRQPSPSRDTTVRRPSLSGGSDHREATPPPISREPSQLSPTWEPSSRGLGNRYPSEDRPQHRFANSRDITMNTDGRQKHKTNENMSHGSDRFYSEPGIHQPGSLEGRLGDRYDSQDPFVEVVRQPHALPPNPTLHPDHHSIAPESRQKSFPDRRGSSNEERSQTIWADATSQSLSTEVRVFDDKGPPRDIRNPRLQKSIRSRKPPAMNMALQDDSVGVDMDVDKFLPESSQYGQQRPAILKRGGSLLDRLSLDHNDDTQGMAAPWSSSLRDRVQVPSKRDRDEMMGGRYQPDNSFEGDDVGFGDPTTSKKPRRRNGNKFRRGGKRGGMA